MPPKSQQPRDKDGKFLPKNGQPPSSLATPSASAQSTSTRRVAREASPTRSASRARSTSRSRSKRPEQPLKSPPKEPSGSKSKLPESPAETITINLKQSQDKQRTEDPSLPTQDSSKSRPSSPASDLSSESDSESSLLEFTTDDPNQDLNTSSVSVPAFARAVRSIISMRQSEDEAPRSTYRNEEGTSRSRSPSRFFPTRRTSHPHQSSPTSKRRTHFTTPHPPSFPTTGSSCKSPSGVAAMPAPRSQWAPRFSARDDELLSEFLHEYEDLADGNGLTEKQKVETIIRYVPRDLRKLWKTLPGYRNTKWRRFREELVELYPDITEQACTREDLSQFVKLSAESHIRSENDVMKYYRSFLTIAVPLADDHELTAKDFNAEFFRGFHKDDQKIIAEQILFSINPRHPPTEPFDINDVVTAARQFFASNRFYKPPRQKVRREHRGRSKTRRSNSGNLVYRLLGDRRSPRPAPYDSDSDSDSGSDSDQEEDSATERSAYKTRSVHFKEDHSSRAQSKDEDESMTLLTKLSNLSIHEPSYLILYSKCQKRFPDIAQNLAKPDLRAPLPSATATVAFQSPPAPVYQPPPTPARQPWEQRAPPPPADTNEGDLFFSERNGARSRGCMFCGMLGHRVRGCPAAEEYYRTNRLKVIDGRLHLPTGEPIPNDGRGQGLKASLDAWLAANTQVPTSTPQRDPPPHTTSYSFEISPEPPVATGAYIAEEADSDSGDEDDVYTSELYDMYEVFAAKKKDSGPSKTPASTQVNPPPPPSSKVPPVPPTPISRTPQYRYQASAEDQALTKELLDCILKGTLDKVTPAHILAASPLVRKELVEHLRPRRVETASFEEADEEDADPVSVLGLAAKREAEFSLPLREVDILVNHHSTEAGVLDQGSQIVVIREDLANEVGAKINTRRTLRMEGANGSTSRTLGCAEDLEMQIGDVSFTMHAHVVRTAPFRLLLGRPFHHLLLCRLEDHPDRVDVSIRDPADPSRSIAVPSRARQATQVGFVTTLTCQVQPEPPHMEALERYVASSLHPFIGNEDLSDSDQHIEALAYKKAAKKVHPVAASLPEDFRVIRRRPEDPLLSLPALPSHPPEFLPGTRLTQDRLDALELDKPNFLWPEEVKLAMHVLKVNEMALAWTEAERGRFRDEYFSPVKIPTVAHTPWVHKNIPIPTGLLDKVIDMFKEKIAAGVYEPSDASYRSRWFCVPKKNGSLRLVHDLQPLNAVTIRNAAVPPLVDQFVEGIAAHSCYSMLDLLVGYDHRTLDVASRDLTSFQSPLGALRNTTLPQGSTNAVAIFHGDVTFILEPEIPNVAKPFLDDTVVMGPRSRYETPEGGYETMPNNSGIRRFIFEHLSDVHRVLHRLGHAGAAVSAKKIFLAVPEVIVLGHKCTYEGRIPDDSKVVKVRTWPPCKTVSDVRAFLGTAGTMRIWIKDFSSIARPLVDLTRKDADFVWQDEHDRAMEQLKSAIIASPALIPIDYKSERKVYLAVDSSFRAVGWILSQDCEDGQRRPSRFGSIGWNERESRYSQPKTELYGLFRTLRALRMHVVGITNLVVEMDAQYVRGMLSNPDVQPNAAINRWIAAILLFDFELVHIPAEKHHGPDGLSRREPIPGEDDDEGDPEEWVDEVLSLGIWLDTWNEHRPVHASTTATVFQATEGVSTLRDELMFPPPSDKARARDDELPKIYKFLANGKQPSGQHTAELDYLHRRSRPFFLHDKRLWRRNAQGRHQLVIMQGPQRYSLTRDAHDKLGHKGFYSTLRALLDRFWWPSLADDVKWYIKSCHECQIRQTTKVRIPPTVATPAPLFRKAYVDTMFMPHASGFRYIVQARCSLTAWPEWRALRTETGRTLGAFLFEEVLCRWGAVEEIVTDNGTAYVAALDWLAKRYGIRHIRISAYNSRANGIVERQHRTIRESIVKACEGDIAKWPAVAPFAFWADRATTRKSTGHSPFYMAHGIEPVLPFDITLATFLVPNLANPLTTVELITTRIRQLQRREDDLAAIHSNVLKSRFESVRQFERQYENTIRDFDLRPGALVLVRNSSVETDLGRKAKPRYLGPMVVIRRTQNGSYRLAELDGTISNLRFAAFRLVPYHARSRTTIPVTRLVDRSDLARVFADEDVEGVVEGAEEV